MADKKTETVTLKLASGEEVDFIVPVGMDDAQVRSFVQQKKPELFAQKQPSETGASQQQRQQSELATQAQHVNDPLNTPMPQGMRGADILGPGAGAASRIGGILGQVGDWAKGAKDLFQKAGDAGTLSPGMTGLSVGAAGAVQKGASVGQGAVSPTNLALGAGMMTPAAPLIGAGLIAHGAMTATSGLTDKRGGPMVGAHGIGNPEAWDKTLSGGSEMAAGGAAIRGAPSRAMNQGEAVDTMSKAANPLAKDMPQATENLKGQLDTIVRHAQTEGVTVKTTNDAIGVIERAAEADPYRSKIITPNKSVDTEVSDLYQGKLASKGGSKTTHDPSLQTSGGGQLEAGGQTIQMPRKATVEQLDSRLQEINKMVRPKALRGSQGSPAVREQQIKLQQEAQYIRKTLAETISKKTGIPAEQVAKMRSNYEQLREIAYDLELEKNQISRRSQTIKNRPLSVKNIKDRIGDQQLSMRTGQDARIAKVFSRYTPGQAPVQPSAPTQGGGGGTSQFKLENHTTPVNDDMGSMHQMEVHTGGSKVADVEFDVNPEGTEITNLRIGKRDANGEFSYADKNKAKIGIAGIKDLKAQLKAKFPNAKIVSGTRVTGTRGSQGGTQSSPF